MGALEKAGVIRVTDLRKSQMNEQFSWDKFMQAAQNPFGVDLDIALREDVDQAQIDKRPKAGICLKLPPIKIERIVRIDPVKGGTTLKWDGLSFMWHGVVESGTALTASYFANLPPARRYGNSAKARYLYRHDPFLSQWRFVAADYAPIHAQDFTTRSVISALQRD